MNAGYEYPMWFMDRDEQYVVRFESLNSGKVIKAGKFKYPKKDLFSDEWIVHTNASVWINVTDQYKDRKEVSSIGACKFNFGGYSKNEHKTDTQTIEICDVPKCQHEISFDDECKECDKLYKEFNRPKVSHYQSGGIEPIYFINSHNFNFNISNCIKYCIRAGLKGDAIEDLQKAIHYLQFEIERLENVQK